MVYETNQGEIMIKLVEDRIKMKSVTLFLILYVISGKKCLGDYNFTYHMAAQCKEYTCQQGSKYETFFSADANTRTKLEPGVKFEMHFATRGPNDGHILLSTTAKPAESDPVYQFEIGCRSNTATLLRRGVLTKILETASLLKTVTTPGIMSPIKFNAFYIRVYKDGTVEMGKEGDKLPLISYLDKHPIQVKYFSFTTWGNAVVNFLYDCPVGTEELLSQNCKGGSVLSCDPCEDDSCDIFWNSTAHCKVVTEDCEPRLCVCNNELGWFWNPESKTCVDKAACVQAIDCSKELPDSRLYCNLGECQPTCDNQCQWNVSDPVTCTKKPECMCPNDSVLVDDEINGKYCEIFKFACISESCGPNAEHRCNDNNCKERTFEDFMNNVPYEECTFGSIENCPYNKQECWCQKNYIKTDKGCLLTEQLIQDKYKCPAKSSTRCITEACPEKVCGVKGNPNCVKDKNYPCTFDKLYCQCGAIFIINKDHTVCERC